MSVPQTQAAPAPDGRSPWWKEKGFPLLLTAQVLVGLGDHLMSLTLTVVVFKLFGTGAALGTYFVCRALPAAILGPVAGVFVDRYNRRTLAALACLLSAAVAATLPFTAAGTGLLLGAILIATAGAVTGPALQAALPQILPRERFLAANSMISAVGTVSRLIGPAISAVLVVAYGSAAGFFAAAAAYLLGALVLSALKLPSPDWGGDRFDGRAFFGFLKAGLQYLVSRSIVLWVTLVTTVVMFADSCVAPLFTLLLQRELGTPPEFIGYLSAAFGLGVFLGSISLPMVNRRVREDRLLSVGVLAVGAQMVLYSVIGVFGWALPLQVVSGFGFAYVLNTTRTIFQKVVPNEIIGRVVAAAMALSAFLNLFAFKAGGLLADTAGVRTVFLIAGLLTAAVALASLYYVNLGRPERSDASATPAAAPPV